MRRSTPSSIDPFDSPWRPSSDPIGDVRAITMAHGRAFREDGPAPQCRRRVRSIIAAEVARFERGLLEQSFHASRHNQSETARALGLGYHQLRRLLKKHDLT